MHDVMRFQTRQPRTYSNFMGSAPLKDVSINEDDNDI